MILDNISNIKKYKGIHKGLDKAIDYILSNDISNVEAGKQIIDGDNLYFISQEYDTKTYEDGKLEAHKKYIDIQYVISGEEYIGYNNISDLKVTTDYIEEKDVTFYEKDCDMHRLSTGDFAIYFINDAHMPGVNDKTEKVKKVVFKILYDGDYND